MRGCTAGLPEQALSKALAVHTQLSTRGCSSTMDPASVSSSQASAAASTRPLWWSGHGSGCPCDGGKHVLSGRCCSQGAVDVSQAGSGLWSDIFLSVF